MNNYTKRISSIDSLRGLAILLVLMFHTYARWTDYMPWATIHRELPFFKYGYLGVELFFLISGFVIYMTLERCNTFFEFIYKRWLRLFPAMFIGTILIYCTSSIFHERPAGIPKLLDTLPGILFIDPIILNKLLKDVKSIEGVFWYLFVEVKFYFLFGIIYFTINTKGKAIYILLLIFLLHFSYVAMLKFNIIKNIYYANAIISLLSLGSLGWFCAGAFLYKAHIEGRYLHKGISIAAALPSIMLIGWGQLDVILACASICLLFYLGIYCNIVACILNQKIFQGLGFISYPLYLIHENAMVSMSIKTHNYFNDGGILTPLPGLAIIVAVSYFIAKHGEPMLRKILDQLVNRLTQKSQ